MCVPFEYPMNPYLSASAVVDYLDPAVEQLASDLRGDGALTGVIGRTFDWVKDQVRHSADCDDDRVTCCASEVLAARVGLCYAKSHLLVALLRANGVQAGFCYQRLATEVSGCFCLHGLAAVWISGARWCRIDPRGGERGAGARFAPPEERLVYDPTALGEYDVDGVYAEPLAHVVAALRSSPSMRGLMGALPDVIPAAEWI
ncbi:transglutaminase-like superfamily protein [mine drainage metagenome]|uniref:Transglutaminase-like superfamily protein n=1 Tax=mine drainage metagenome TaxID=410659 RepID=A0A1J5R7C9_9ZZZZ